MLEHQNVTKAVGTNDTRTEVRKNIPGPSTVKSVQKTMTGKLSTSTSIARKKGLLQFKAAEEKARIRMELIDQKLAMDLSEAERESSCSLQSEEHNDRLVEDWIDSSQQEVQALSPPPPVAVPALEARPPPPATAQGGTNDTVHALASALKDLAAISASGANGCNDRMLNRLCTPRDLPSYSGDPLEWLQFKRAYEESSQVCNFSDRENLWRLRRSLHGPAKDAVTALLIGATSPDAVMLELQFGNPDVIISRILQDITRLRPMAQEYQREIIPFSIKIKNCVAAVSAMGCQEHIHGTSVVSVILSKLPTILISKWTDYSYPLISERTKPKLVILSEFLSEEAVKISKTFVSVSSLQNYPKHNYSENYRNRTQTLLVHNELSDIINTCRFCRTSKHSLADCKKFRKALRKDRWTYVKRNGICFKCLTSRHTQHNCTAPVCDIDACGLSHHRLLHYTVNKASPQCNSVNITDVTETNPTVETITNINNNSRKVLLKTVPMNLHGPSGTVRTIALLDDGSTVTLISDALASRVGLRGTKQSMRVCGAWDNSEIVCDSEILDLELSNKDETMFNIRARRVNNMALPVQSVTASELRDYELMKPEINDLISNGQCKPELLIGQDNYELLLPLEIIKGKPNELYCTRTPLGWCIHGCLRSSYDGRAPSQSTLFLSQEPSSASTESERILRDMHEEMRQSFAIDSVGISSKPRQNIEDVRAREHLERTAKLIDESCYVRLPRNDSNCVIADSYPIALVRPRLVQKKMKSNPGFAVKYRERIDNLFDTLGFDVSLKRIPTTISTAKKKNARREMLRVLISKFDVYGFLSPITIKRKIMLHDTWKPGISCDDVIPDKASESYDLSTNALNSEPPPPPTPPSHAPQHRGLA